MCVATATRGERGQFSFWSAKNQLAHVAARPNSQDTPKYEAPVNGEYVVQKGRVRVSEESLNGVHLGLVVAVQAQGYAYQINR